jgi:ribonucleases P/MRP protein subunit RPP40
MIIFQNFFDVRAGVPQGSNLGPVLWSIYINDLQKHVENETEKCTVGKFADDVRISTFSTNKDDLKVQMHAALQRAINWSKSNSTILSESKCFLMLFSRGRMEKIMFDLECDGINVKYIDVFKYLGLRIDTKLSFNEQHDYVLRSMLARIRMIGRYKTFFSVKRLKVFTDSLVVSLLNYCLPIWGYQKETKLDQLNNVLVKMSNIVAGKARNVPDLRLDVVGRRNFFSADFVFKHVVNNSQLSDKLRCMFTVKQSERILRDKCSLVIPRVNTAFGQASPSYQMIKMWNSLPIAIRESDSINEFRSNLKAFLLDSGLCFKF